MQFKSISLLILLAVPAVFQAQNKSPMAYQKSFEVGPFIGLALYSGDVAQNRIVLGETKAAYGLIVRSHFARHWAVRAHVLRGDISGADKNSSDAGIKERNFKFFSPVTELGGVVEYHLFDRDRESGTGLASRTITPYLFAGGAAAFIHPTVTCDRTGTGSLEPCPTFPEPGQKRVRPSIPLGVGLRADIVEQLSFSVELGWRPTFSDDIDGVSKNGNANANDWYTFFGASLSYVFGKGQKTGF